MNSKDLKFIYFGTPIVASKTLDILKENGYTPELIVTSPDKPSGRGLEIHETPTSLWAKENMIDCTKPDKITEEFINSLPEVDLYIVVAYGKILPENLINKPRLGTINIHYSLLPLYRGASPLEACLLNGDDKTGISIQQMEYKLDSGPILIEKEFKIDINESKNKLRDELIIMGAKSLCEILPKIINKEITPKKQDETMATFCKKIKKEDGEIDPNGNALSNWNKYRAFDGWPGVLFFINKNGNKFRIKIKEAIYENNSFIIKRVVPEGKKELSYEEFTKSYTI